ncbi:hypothetical protein ACIP5N_27610 [Streptomyces sp. NPDC088768]|uniref:hypothetical protein n=1 Tax=Streptomyces sp. NPDC088768 TaxID=3365894 RepID=UPI003815F20A
MRVVLYGSAWSFPVRATRRRVEGLCHAFGLHFSYEATGGPDTDTPLVRLFDGDTTIAERSGTASEADWRVFLGIPPRWMGSVAPE